MAATEHPYLDNPTAPAAFTQATRLAPCTRCGDPACYGFDLAGYGRCCLDCCLESVDHASLLTARVVFAARALRGLDPDEVARALKLAGSER